MSFSDHSIPKENDILKENDPKLETVKKPTYEEANEIEVMKKLQVMQNMNPAIKALMNYRGNSTRHDVICAFSNNFYTIIYIIFLTICNI